MAKEYVICRHWLGRRKDDPVGWRSTQPSQPPASTVLKKQAAVHAARVEENAEETASSISKWTMGHPMSPLLPPAGLPQPHVPGFELTEELLDSRTTDTGTLVKNSKHFIFLKKSRARVTSYEQVLPRTREIRSTC